MKDFIQKIQKDLTTLQKTLQKGGDDFVRKIEQLAKSPTIQAKKEEIQEIVSDKIRKFEPAFEQFIGSLKTNAKKAGIDITDIEKKVTKAARSATSKIVNSPVVKKSKSVSMAKKTAKAKTAKKTATKSSRKTNSNAE